MRHASTLTHWRQDFLSALGLLAQASARLPIGVPDPVLSGRSAVELYTGSQWPAASLDVVCANARHLTSELFAVGFRWSDRPRQADAGLWHTDLKIGIDIIEPVDQPSAAEQANWLRVAIDFGHSEPGDDRCLKAIGIEDLIIQQAGHWIVDGAPHGEAMTQLSTLVGLAREGVCGPLRTGYLRRCLARVADEDVMIDLIPRDEGWAQSVAPRTLGLTEMRDRIDVWRDRHGLRHEPLNTEDPDQFLREGGRSRARNDRPACQEQARNPPAKLLPFGSRPSMRPG